MNGQTPVPDEEMEKLEQRRADLENEKRAQRRAGVFVGLWVGLLLAAIVLIWNRDNVETIWYKVRREIRRLFKS